MDPERVLTSVFHFTARQGGCSLGARLIVRCAFYVPSVHAWWSREETFNSTCSRSF